MSVLRVDKSIGTAFENSENGIVQIRCEKSSFDAGVTAKPYTHAVAVKTACKSYIKGYPVLDNFSMQVERGTIYSLLGASGCGKTTMLSCIVGLRKLDSGEVRVFGYQPGTPESGIPGKTIGYMPQDIALYQAFRIREIFSYFGRVYGLTKTEIRTRGEFLVNFLNLPDSSKLIKNLSGGEQRRTSLAVAMLHQPELLILDEPTVGVDPLIRESIWVHLRDLIEKRGTTIIITTHYIEEARESNTVGIMRNGRLLAEQSPESLLDEFNAVLLQTVVLKLCENDAQKHNSKADELNNAASGSTVEIVTVTPSSPSNVCDAKGTKSIMEVNNLPSNGIKDKSFSFNANQRKSYRLNSVRSGVKGNFYKVLAVTAKNYVTLIRTPWFPIALILIPTIHMIIFNLILGKDPKYTTLGVVNNEVPEGIRSNVIEFCRNYDQGCFSNWTSCKYLNLFPESEIHWIPYNSETEAIKSVQKGTTWGFISFPENYTSHMADRSLLKFYSDNETIDGTQIATHLDMSDTLKSTYIKNQLLHKFETYIMKLTRECGGNPKHMEIPLKFQTVYGSTKGGYIEYLQPTQLSMVIFMIPMASCLTYISDRKAGTLERSLVAGVKDIHILIAYMISEGSLIIIQLILSFGILLTVFDFSVKGSYLMFYLIVFLEGLTGLSLGFLIAVICNHEVEALFCIIGMYLPIMVSSGANWPLQGLPPWAKFLSYSLPISWPMDALRSIVTRGWTFSHPQMWPAFAIMASWIVGVSIVSGLFIKFKRN